MGPPQVSKPLLVSLLLLSRLLEFQDIQTLFLQADGKMGAWKSWERSLPGLSRVLQWAGTPRISVRTDPWQPAAQPTAEWFSPLCLGKNFTFS